MVQVRLVEDEAARRLCLRLRWTVFVEEQGVPPSLEVDQHDSSGAVHALGLLDGVPAGTGRFVFVEPGLARIGRMAVRAPYRQRGVGSAILLHLMELARLVGIRTVTLAGQLHAIPFYERHGFVAHGDIFLDAGSWSLPAAAMSKRNSSGMLPRRK